MNETDLIAAIADDPDDDGAWLVYADWLEEQGDVRAEYLRLVVEIDRIGVDEARAEGLVARLSELTETETIAFPGDEYGQFAVDRRRGFVTGVHMSGEDAVLAGQRVLRASPVRSLTLTAIDGHAKGIAAIPELRRIRILRIAWPSKRVGDTATLLRSPHLVNLESLELSACRVGLGAFEAIRRLPSPLVRLTIQDYRWNPDWLESLVAAPALRELEFLDLSQNAPRFETRHLAYLERLLETETLREVDLRGTSFDPFAVDALARRYDGRVTIRHS